MGGPEFRLGLRSGPPGGEAKERPFGLSESQQILVIKALDGQKNKPSGLIALAQEKKLNPLLDSGWGGTTFPDEVELLVQGDRRTLVETFPDSGSCRDHWIGVARWTPVGPDGTPRRKEARFVSGGSDWFYEKGLAAWAKGDVLGTLRYLAPAAAWSAPMGGAVAGRLSQAFYAQAKLKDKLKPLVVPVGKSLTLLAEPHPEARVISTINGRGPAPPGEPDLRRLLTPKAADGYRRFDAKGRWELVAAPGMWAVGFVDLKAINKLDPKPAQPGASPPGQPKLPPGSKGLK